MFKRIGRFLLVSTLRNNETARGVRKIGIFSFALVKGRSPILECPNLRHCDFKCIVFF